MNCVQPLTAWWSRSPNEYGHHYAAFGLRDGCSDRPLTLPCGKCIGCIKDRARDWSVRCYHESLCHERNSFVTLTYRDPAPVALVKSDLQGFFKRLRFHGYKFRYFGVGEYGSKTKRPHYHVLFFGEDFAAGASRAFPTDRTYVNDWVAGCWGLGNVLIGSVDPESCFYTAGYQLKSMDHPDAFNLVSRRPFLGKGWLDRFHDDCARNGFVTIDGNKLPVPAAYLSRPERLLDFDSLKDRRREFSEGRPDSAAGQLARTARSREINLLSAAKSAGGEL